MTEAELMQLLAAITPPDDTACAAAHAHWASLAKPLGGLGASGNAAGGRRRADRHRHSLIFPAGQWRCSAQTMA